MDINFLGVSQFPISNGAIYTCTLINEWSGANHPIEYPSGRAQWTPPVLVAHSKFADLWSPGEFASPGIENVVEEGLTATLESELDVLKAFGLVGDVVVGETQFNGSDPPQVFNQITLTPSAPYLSTISMMGPSPDWFTGIDSFSPRGPGGKWLRFFEIATYPFDAGTEQGTTYSIENEPESPHGPIYQLTRDTVPDGGILLDPTGTTVLPVARWQCDLSFSDTVANVEAFNMRNGGGEPPEDLPEAVPEVAMEVSMMGGGESKESMVEDIPGFAMEYGMGGGLRKK